MITYENLVLFGIPTALLGLAWIIVFIGRWMDGGPMWRDTPE